MRQICQISIITLSRVGPSLICVVSIAFGVLLGLGGIVTGYFALTLLRFF